MVTNFLDQGHRTSTMLSSKHESTEIPYSINPLKHTASDDYTSKHSVPSRS